MSNIRHFSRPRPLRHALALGLMLAFALPAPAALDRGADDLYEHAVQLREERDAVAAIIELKSALQADPDHLSSQLLIGEIYLDQGLGAAAEEALRSALKRGADRNTVIPMLGKSLLRQGKYAKVITELSADGLTDDNAAQVYTVRAQAMLGQRLRRKAEAELNKALALTPYGLEANLVRVSLLLQARDYAEAERQAQGLVKEHPSEPDAWLAVSSVALVQGDHAGALAGYSRALEASPRHLTARLSRIALLVDQGRDAEAKPDFDYLEKEFSRDPRASYMRAVWLARTTDGKGTTEALTSVLDAVKELNDRVFAEDPVLNLMTGMSYYGLGNFQQAVTRLQSYVKHQPADYGARKALGDALLRLGDAAQAAVALEPAVENNPRDARAVSLLASAYAMTQRFRQANSLLEQAIARGGNDDELAPKLALLQLSTGNFRDGLPALDRHFAEDQDNGQLGVPLVAAYLNAGDTGRAIEVAETLHKAQPDNPLYTNLLGVAHFKAGTMDRAEALFNEALRTSPGFMPAVMNLAKLELAVGKVDAARARISPLLKAKPDSAALLLDMSRIEMAAGNQRDGLKLAEDAFRKAPKDRAALFHLFDVRVATGKFDAASDLIVAAEGDYPGDFDVLARHGDLLLRTGKRDALRPLLKKMADTATQHNGQLLTTARVQMQQGFHSDADYTLSKAFLNNATDEQAGLLAVQIALQKGDPQDAMRRAQTQLERWPDSPATHMIHGEAAMAVGDFASALTSFDAVLTRQAATPAVIRGYNALVAMQNDAAARARLVDWLATHPDDLEVKNTLAEDHVRLREFAAANELLEALLAARPDDPPLLNNIANTRFALGNAAAAVDAARAAVKGDPENALFNDTLGWLLVQSKQLEEGLPFLRTASARMAENPEIRFHLASCLHRLGREAEARKELDKALRTDAAFEGRDAALELQKTLITQADS